MYYMSVYKLRKQKQQQINKAVVKIYLQESKFICCKCIPRNISSVIFDVNQFRKINILSEQFHLGEINMTHWLILKTNLLVACG